MGRADPAVAKTTVNLRFPAVKTRKASALTLADEEAKLIYAKDSYAIGLDFLDGHCYIVGNGRTISSNSIY